METRLPTYEILIPNGVRLRKPVNCFRGNPNRDSPFNFLSIQESSDRRTDAEKKQTLNCHYYYATNMDYLEFPDEFVDQFVVSGDLDHDHVLATSEIDRCLKSGGIVHFANYGIDASYHAIYHSLTADYGYEMVEQKCHQSNHGLAAGSYCSSSNFLSVIICTYNRPERLIHCLRSALRQTLPKSNYEILIIDNNSTTPVSALLEEENIKDLPVRIIREIRQGLSVARNRGACEARGDYLIYIDDDAFLPANFLAALQSVLDQHKPDILGGPVFPFFSDRKPTWFHIEWEVRGANTETGFSNDCKISGSNFCIRRELLAEIGYFDANLGMHGSKLGLMEEWDVVNRYRQRVPVEKQKVYFSNDCLVRHHTPLEKMNYAYMLQRTFAGFRQRARLSDGVLHFIGKKTTVKKKKNKSGAKQSTPVYPNYSYKILHLIVSFLGCCVGRLENLLGFHARTEG